MKSKVQKWFLVALIVGAFSLCVQLFEKDFRSAQVYPELSSLRTDPLGTSVLYELSDSILEAGCDRNHLSLPDWSHLDSKSLLIIIGLSPWSLSNQENQKQINSALEQGARVWVTLDSGASKPLPKDDEENEWDEGEFSDNIGTLSANALLSSDNTWLSSDNVEAISSGNSWWVHNLPWGMEVERGPLDEAVLAECLPVEQFLPWSTRWFIDFNEED